MRGDHRPDWQEDPGDADPPDLGPGVPGADRPLAAPRHVNCRCTTLSYDRAAASQRESRAAAERLWDAVQRQMRS